MVTILKKLEKIARRRRAQAFRFKRSPASIQLTKQIQQQRQGLEEQKQLEEKIKKLSEEQRRFQRFEREGTKLFKVRAVKGLRTFPGLKVFLTPSQENRARIIANRNLRKGKSTPDRRRIFRANPDAPGAIYGRVLELVQRSRLSTVRRFTQGIKTDAGRRLAQKRAQRFIFSSEQKRAEAIGRAKEVRRFAREIKELKIRKEKLVPKKLSEIEKRVISGVAPSPRAITVKKDRVVDLRTRRIKFKAKVKEVVQKLNKKIPTNERGLVGFLNLDKEKQAELKRNYITETKSFTQTGKGTVITTQREKTFFEKLNIDSDSKNSQKLKRDVEFNQVLLNTGGLTRKQAEQRNDQSLKEFQKKQIIRGLPGNVALGVGFALLRLVPVVGQVATVALGADMILRRKQTLQALKDFPGPTIASFGAFAFGAALGGVVGTKALRSVISTKSLKNAQKTSIDSFIVEKGKIKKTPFSSTFPKEVKFKINERAIKKYIIKDLARKGIDFIKLSKENKNFLIGQVKAKIALEPSLFIPKARRRALRNFKKEKLNRLIKERLEGKFQQLIIFERIAKSKKERKKTLRIPSRQRLALARFNKKIRKEKKGIFISLTKEAISDIKSKRENIKARLKSGADIFKLGKDGKVKIIRARGKRKKKKKGIEVSLTKEFVSDIKSNIRNQLNRLKSGADLIRIKKGKIKIVKARGKRKKKKIPKGIRAKLTEEAISDIKSKMENQRARLKSGADLIRIGKDGRPRIVPARGKKRKKGIFIRLTEETILDIKLNRKIVESRLKEGRDIIKIKRGKIEIKPSKEFARPTGKQQQLLVQKQVQKQVKATRIKKIKIIEFQKIDSLRSLTLRNFQKANTKKKLLRAKSSASRLIKKIDEKQRFIEKQKKEHKQKQKLLTKQKQKIKFQGQKLKQRQKKAEKQLLKKGEKTKTEQRQKQRSRLRFAFNQQQQQLKLKSKQAQIQKQVQKQKLLTKQKQKLRQVQRFALKLRQIELPKVKTKLRLRVKQRLRGKKKIITKISRRKKKRIFIKKKEKAQGFNVFARPWKKRKGVKRSKQIKVNKRPLEKRKAKDLRNFVVDHSLSRRGRITKTTGRPKKPFLKVPKGYSKRTKFKFRTFRRRKGKRIPLKKFNVIERSAKGRNFLLDTKSEKKQITLRKKIATLNKEAKKRTKQKKQMSSKQLSNLAKGRKIRMANLKKKR